MLQLDLWALFACVATAPWACALTSDMSSTMVARAMRSAMQRDGRAVGRRISVIVAGQLSGAAKAGEFAVSRQAHSAATT
ncbi:hypothetical protein [Roseateles sp. LYH14W]|uniref:Uncharacterized protein n=1 Tax=Pelomonas parva TaxID=3299032 RepID=A0ABW7F888_9BURK